MKKIFTFLAFPLASLFSGCVFFQSDAKISSFANPEKFPEQFQYTLESSNPNLSADDLEFIKYAKIVEEMLAAKGFKSVPVDDANCIVKMNYGILGSETSYSTFNSPIYGTTGYSSARTKDGRSVTPVYGVVGYDSVTTSQRVYTRFLSLECWERRAHDGASKQQLWKTMAESNGYSDDMYENFPLLALATFPWIGKNSDGKKTISEFDSDALEKLQAEMKATSSKQ